MKPKITHALAGLALALVLALVAASPSSSSTSTDSADADGEVVAAASEWRTEVTTRFGELFPTTTTVPGELLHQMKHLPLDSEALTLSPAPEPESEPAAQPTAAPTPVAETRPEPQPEPAPAPAPSGSIDEIINRHFGAAAPRAKQIARCESNMNPNAVSRTNDHGLFQINIVHQGNFQAVTGQPWSAVYNPEFNTMYAKHLYNQSGWGPWTCNRKV